MGFLEEVTVLPGQGCCSEKLLVFLKSREWKPFAEEVPTPECEAQPAGLA